MKIELFIQMLNDKYCLSFEKLKYKYGMENLSKYMEHLKSGFTSSLPITDIHGNNLYYLPSKIGFNTQLSKLFIDKINKFSSLHSMEDEIISTLSIENIDSSRDSVRQILKGYAPDTEDEKKAYGIKKGLDFISDISNVINEENLYKLYSISCGEYVDEKNKLLPGNKYRHDKVYVVGTKIGNDILHQGVDHNIISGKINDLINFINNENKIDDIIKSIISHYYFAYLHPYFDGNGRTARLLQTWVLVQKGYSASIYLPFSKYISKQKNKYYKVFETIFHNFELSGFLDITPFIKFFTENVIDSLHNDFNNNNVTDNFFSLLQQGKITPKERELFYFILSNYGENEFSTKMLEKDFDNAAYATIRNFCIKFEKNGFLTSVKLSNRTRYKITVF